MFTYRFIYGLLFWLTNHLFLLKGLFTSIQSLSFWSFPEFQSINSSIIYFKIQLPFLLLNRTKLPKTYFFLGGCSIQFPFILESLLVFPFPLHSAYLFSWYTKLAFSTNNVNRNVLSHSHFHIFQHMFISRKGQHYVAHYLLSVIAGSWNVSIPTFNKHSAKCTVIQLLT